MNLRTLDKDKKVFLFIGLPAFIFLIFAILTHYVQFSVFFIIIIAIAALGLLRRNKIWLRLTKVSVFGIIAYFVLFNNVLLLPSQIARRLPGGRNSLLEPQHAKIIEFKGDFETWYEDRYFENFSDTSEATREDLETKLKRVDYYVRGVRCEYTFDIYAPYFFYDHIPTIDEIFTSDSDGDGKLQDDCDGLSILTVSLLLNYGYNAFISECEWHWHTLVFPDGADPTTEAGFEQAIYIYNSQGRQTYFIFNETDVIIPPHRPLLLSAYEVFTGERTYTNYLMGFFEGDYIKLDFLPMLAVIFAILFLLSMAITFYTKIGIVSKDRDKKIRRKRFLFTNLLTSLFISLGVFIIYWFTVSGLAAYCNLVVCIMFIFAFRFTEYLIKTKNNNNLELNRKNEQRNN